MMYNNIIITLFLLFGSIGCSQSLVNSVIKDNLVTESNHENSITKAFKYNDSISVLLSDPLCNFKSASKIDTIWQCLKLKKGNIISVIDSSGAYISPFLGGYFIGDAIVFKLYCFTGENNKPTYNSQLLADRDFVPVYLDISNETYADYYSKALDVMPTQSDEFDFADDGTVTDDYKEETYFLLYKIIEIDLKVMNDKKNRIEEDRIEYYIDIFNMLKNEKYNKWFSLLFNKILSYPLQEKTKIKLQEVVKKIETNKM